MSSQSFAGITYTSETSKHRDLLAPYCTGYGIDIGFGGDPITPAALRMDLPQPYARTGDLPVQLGGDCRDLRWFRDDALDYVYSSHVLEDFGEYETEPILREWTRVLRAGGHLVLLLPDQQRYLRYCEAVGLGPNAHHAIAHFSLDYVREVAARLGSLEVLAEFPEIDDYSFAVVFRKTAPTAGEANVVEEMRAKLESAWKEREQLATNLRSCEEELERIRSHPVIGVARRLRRLLRFGIEGAGEAATRSAQRVMARVRPGRLVAPAMRDPLPTRGRRQRRHEETRDRRDAGLHRRGHTRAHLA